MIRATVSPGTKRIVRRIRQTGVEIEDAMARFLEAEAERVLAEAKRLTPVRTGALRDSGTINGPIIKPDSVSVEITFGGVNAPHALVVHERVELRHDAPTQAKFLEQPFNENLDGIETRMRDFVREWMKVKLRAA